MHTSTLSLRLYLSSLSLVWFFVSAHTNKIMNDYPIRKAHVNGKVARQHAPHQVGSVQQRLCLEVDMEITC